jgi:hypothetical protein
MPRPATDPFPHPRRSRHPGAFVADVAAGGEIGHNGGVLTWKPGPLSSPATDQLALRLGDKVRAIVELPGVPEGTEGKVILANGFNWRRHRVLFANGVELGHLDGRSIEPIGSTARRIAKSTSRS